MLHLGASNAVMLTRVGSTAQLTRVKAKRAWEFPVIRGWDLEISLPGSILGQGTKIPQAARHSQKNEKLNTLRPFSPLNSLARLYLIIS